MTTSDPWSDLSPSSRAGRLNSRRVDDSGSSWGFYWGLDDQGVCCFMLQLCAGTKVEEKLPKLKGIQVQFIEDVAGDQRPCLMLRLNDSNRREQFHTFSLDIKASVSADDSSSMALHQTIRRTWRWHHLLRSGGSERLSVLEQKGLIGELHVLRYGISPALNCGLAHDCWTGPLGEAKDFCFATRALECKAISSRSNVVHVSSVEQLDDLVFESLLLAVVYVDESGSVDSKARTVDEFVHNHIQWIMDTDPSCLERAENLLTAAGYSAEEKYTECLFVVGKTVFYTVDNDFPRLVRADLSDGIDNARYSVLLEAMKSHIVTFDEAQRRIIGNK